MRKEIDLPKLTVEDLKKIKTANRGTVMLRSGTQRVKVTVHMGRCGIAAGARAIIKMLIEKIEKNRSDDVVLGSSGCAGDCAHEPMITVEVKGTPPVTYGNLTPEKTAMIFDEHLLKNRVVPTLVLPTTGEDTNTHSAAREALTSQNP
jgi:NADP-reducing hydrogenase subunit HndB